MHLKQRNFPNNYPNNTKDKNPNKRKGSNIHNRHNPNNNRKQINKTSKHKRKNFLTKFPTQGNDRNSRILNRIP